MPRTTRDTLWRFPAIKPVMLPTLRSLLWAGFSAGLLCGIFASVLHQLTTVPLIRQAEAYEQAALRAHLQRNVGDGDAVADHGDGGWRPENGPERAAYTAIADILAAIGFSLLLAAGMVLRGGEIDWRPGLVWGLAGFATFTLAPGIGLPPDIPGNDVAPLAARQLWWVLTAAATGGGLALLLFARRPGYAVAGLVLIVLPHLYGAPQPGSDALATVPAALARRFSAAVTVSSFLFWAVLGTTTGAFYRLFFRRTN